MIPIKPKLLRILEAQCEGIINIPSLDFLTGADSLFCKLSVPEFVGQFVSTQEDSITAIKFNNLDEVGIPGTRMYLVSNTADIINEFALASAFDFNDTVLFTGDSFSVPDEAVPTSMAWKPDGTELFVAGDVNATVFQYEVTNGGYNLADVVTPKRTQVLATGESVPTGLVFNDGAGAQAGKKLYISFSGPVAKVSQYTLNTAYSLQDGFSKDGEFDVSDEEGNPRSVEFSTDGKRMFITGRNEDKVHQYSVSNAFDITTGIVKLVKEFDVDAQTNEPLGLTFSVDGLQMFVADATAAKTVFQYLLPSSFQL